MITMQRVTDGEVFQSAKLPSAEIDGILGQIEKTSFDYPNSWQAELRVRQTSLGDADGLVVETTKLLCGGTGNCQTWVFRRSNERWSMFQHQAPITSAFGFSDERSRAIRILATFAHVSAADSASACLSLTATTTVKRGATRSPVSEIPKRKWHWRNKPCAGTSRSDG
jgi:hypothetical protein